MTAVSRIISRSHTASLQPNVMQAAHETGIHPRVEDWYAAYAVDEALGASAPANVLVIDDVLTLERASMASSGGSRSGFLAWAPPSEREKNAELLKSGMSRAARSSTRSVETLKVQ